MMIVKFRTWFRKKFLSWLLFEKRVPMNQIGMSRFNAPTILGPSYKREGIAPRRFAANCNTRRRWRAKEISTNLIKNKKFK